MINPVSLAAIEPNDTINGCNDGIAISIWFQGCPHKCKGCHNPETWNNTDGEMIEYDSIVEFIKEYATENKINRNLSLLGGEPLSVSNRKYAIQLIRDFHKMYPNRKIFLWTGYTMEELLKFDKNDFETLKLVDLLITDRFDINKRNINIKFRGSSNQRVWIVKQIFSHKYFKNVTNIIDK